MNYKDLLKSIIPEILLASQLINNPEVDPEVRQRNQEILFDEVGTAVYSKTYDMNAFDYGIEHTTGTGINNQHYGLAKIISGSVSAGDIANDALIASFLTEAIGKAQKDSFQIASETKNHPTVTRTTVGKTCAWCQGLAGTYADPEPDVFRRHTDCDCKIVTSGYKSRNGLLKNYAKKVAA